MRRMMIGNSFWASGCKVASPLRARVRDAGGGVAVDPHHGQSRGGGAGAVVVRPEQPGAGAVHHRVPP